MTLDPRAKKLAEIVIDYSTSINESDTLLIRTEKEFLPFANEIKRLAKEKGANVNYLIPDLQRNKEIIERADETELKEEAERICEIAKPTTAFIGIYATANKNNLKGVDPDKIAKYMQIVKRPYSNLIGKTKWNVLGYPCSEHAQEAGMSLKEYENFVYSATNIDWTKTTNQMQRIKDLFDDAKDVQIYVPKKTDLHLSLEGRGGGICDGKFNMPDGEVFYGPVENSLEGKIYFPYETMRDGNIVGGITLQYKNGEIVKFNAEKNQNFLRSMINLPGVEKVGEFGIGSNYGITKYTKNLLFDEKIGGTIHLAIGNSYKLPLDAGGGLNTADIHWDLVCDLRKNEYNPGGELRVDGKLVQKNGIWLFK